MIQQNFTPEDLQRILADVEANADTKWREAALAAIWSTCQKLPDFISDDIWTIGELESTREDRALGPMLIQARKLGWCAKTDRVRPSKRSHLSGKPVWRSLVFAGQEK